MAASQEFTPTPDQRKLAETLSGYGIPQTDIAHLVGCDAKTLRKYFRAELDKGMATANANIGRSLYEQAVGRPAQVDPATGQIVRDELKPDKSAAIFLGKARLGMRDVQRVEHTGRNGGPIQTADIDLALLTDEEFDLFIRLYEKAKRRHAENQARTADGPEVPDA